MQGSVWAYAARPPAGVLLQAGLGIAMGWRCITLEQLVNHSHVDEDGAQLEATYPSILTACEVRDVSKPLECIG